jgi:hypothetical protein
MAKVMSAEDIKKAEISLKNTLKLSQQILAVNEEDAELFGDKTAEATKLNALANKMLKAMKDGKKISEKDLQDAIEKNNIWKDDVKQAQKVIKLKGIEEAALSEVEEQFDAMESKARAYAAKVKSYFTSWKGAAIGIGLVAVALFKVYKDLISAQTDARQQMGMTGENFEKVKELATDVNVEWAKFGVGIKESYEIGKAMVMEFGSIDFLTKDSANNVAAMTVALGMSAEESAKTLAAFMDITGGSQEAANHMIKMAAATADANGVPMGKTVRDIADNAEALSRYTKGTGQNIVDATVAANKLGFSISTITGIADKLLDFESSIEAEMNAMVLTGQQINLGRARALALEGDLVGLQKEVTDNLVTQNEWEEMNTIQRKAMADAIGIGVNEMGKMISRQKALDGLVKGTLKPMEALAQGMSLSEVLDAEGIIDPLKKLMNSLIRLTSIVVKILTPAFETLSNVIALITGDWEDFDMKGFLINLGLVAGALGLIWVIGKGIALLNFSDMFNFGSKAPAAGAAGKKGIFSRIMGGMSWSDIAKGLVIMVGLAAALWLLGEALKNFTGVDWDDLTKAGVAMLGLLAAATLLGALMYSPLGAALLTGMFVLVGMAGALWILGQALQAVKVGMDGLAPSLIAIAGVAGDLVIAAGAIYMLGGALAFLATSLAAGSVLDFFGLGGGGMIDKLLELAAASSDLQMVAESVKTIASGGAGGGVAGTATSMTAAGAIVGDTNVNVSLTDVVEKLDEIESMFRDGMDLKLNGAKIGEWLSKEAENK